MGLITKEVEVTLSGNVKYWENKGYEIPKYKNKSGKMSVKRGTTIMVKIEDLPKQSNIVVEYECDDCGKKTKSSYYNYISSCNKHEGKYLCNKCSAKAKRGKSTKKYFYEIGDIINNSVIEEQIMMKVNKKNGKIGHVKGYKLHCQKHDTYAECYEGNVKKGMSGCKLCNEEIRHSKHRFKVGEVINGLEILEQLTEEVKHCASKSGYTMIRKYKTICRKHNEEFIKTETSLLSGQGCIYCGIENNRGIKTPYKYNVGEIINGLEILEQIEIKSTRNNLALGFTINKGYKVKCVNDGYIYEAPENSLNDGNGCPVCCNRITISGINDIATTHPHVIQYLLNKEDGFKYSRGSSEKVICKCPHCGHIKEETVSHLCSKGLSCSVCGDNVSYPEKFTMCVLKQLNVNFIPQLTKRIFEWVGKYRYDIYFEINNKKYIIEVNGGQHYEETNRKGARTLEEEQENDKLKKELALKNGIDCYIELDCRKSELEWIKNSILNSQLNELFDLSQIDWSECERFCRGSFLVDCCKMWNEHENYTTKDIGKLLNLPRTTVGTYLKRGAKIGLCDYTGEKGRLRASLKTKGSNAYQGKRVYYNGIVYGTIREASEVIGVSEHIVRRWIYKEIEPEDNIEIRLATKEEVEEYNIKH